MIKIIVLDLDKTLLNDRMEISSFSLNVLKRCQKLNYKVIIATARSEVSTLYGLNGYQPNALICNNGALGITENEKFAKYISSKNVDRVIRYLAERKEVQTVKVTTPQKEYSNKENVVKNGVLYTYRDFSKKPLNEEAYKIMISVNAELGLEIMTKFACKYEQVRGERNYIITRADVNKADAVRRIACCYNVKLEEVVAFGDDTSDIAMLELCGAGVAMENALDKVKEAADYVCGNNDEDGVARWLEKHLLV